MIPRNIWVMIFKNLKIDKENLQNKLNEANNIVNNMNKELQINNDKLRDNKIYADDTAKYLSMWRYKELRDQENLDSFIKNLQNKLIEADNTMIFIIL